MNEFNVGGITIEVSETRVGVVLDAPRNEPGKVALKKVLLKYGAGEAEISESQLQGSWSWIALVTMPEAVENIKCGVATANEVKDREVQVRTLLNSLPLGVRLGIAGDTLKGVRRNLDNRHDSGDNDAGRPWFTNWEHHKAYMAVTGAINRCGRALGYLESPSAAAERGEDCGIEYYSIDQVVSIRYNQVARNPPLIGPSGLDYK